MIEDNTKDFRRPVRVGIGGPVGSGKTMLTFALVRSFEGKIFHGRHYKRHLHRGRCSIFGS